jgi:regulator of sigma E protease
MLNILISFIGILITIFLVVGVHELGHFLVAKSVGIKVLRFSIGFGKTLFSWHDKKGTEYVIAAIPLGGYVKMLDESEGAVSADELNATYNRQPFYKKMAVIAAGPFFNLVFAFLIYWLLFVIGFVTIAPVIGKVAPTSIAALAGLQPQQEILQIDNKATRNWTTVVIDLLARAGEKNTLSMQTKDINKNETAATHTLNLSAWHLNELKPDPLDSLGIVPYEPVIPTIIGKIESGTPAAQSRLKIGDNIISIDGRPIKNWTDIHESIASHPNEMVTFVVERNKEKISIPVTIGYKTHFFFQKIGFLGMSPTFDWPKELLRTNKYGPIDALKYAWQDVAMFTNMNFIILKKMFTGKISLQSLGGPITIFQSAGAALNNGVLAFLSFLAFLSISIGIINIVPIPGLDGGHLLFQAIETIMRRPLPEKFLILFYRLGIIFLLLIMVQALANDILRL